MDKSEIVQAYIKAPVALQEYLAGKYIDDDISSIANSLALPISSFLPLKNACTLILLGLADSSELIESLQNNLHVDDIMAKAIANRIDATVLETVSELLSDVSTEEIRNIGLGSASGEDIRSGMLTKKDGPLVLPNQKIESGTGSRSLLMDQLSIIGQIPKDEDVLQRLNKIREQLRKGKDEKDKLDKEITAREETEKIKTLEASKLHITRRIYDVDPYREHVAGEDEEL